MEFLVVALAAFAASGLTLYSGFGLGTLLLPAFALFFPAPVAVAATGVVHLLNNLLKGALLWRGAHWPTVARFGLAAVPFALLGAWLLERLGGGPAFAWSGLGATFAPTWAAVCVGALMMVFAVLELQPWFQHLAAPPRLLPLGGALSGFLGGLTGQQGALRSMFLLKTGLEPARFIATGVVIAVVVDLTRIPVYLAGLSASRASLDGHAWALVATGTLAAAAGAVLAARHAKKATSGLVRVVAAGLMLAIGAALAAGVVGS